MFEWDEAKRLATLAARKLDFVRAVKMFDGRPMASFAAVRGGEARVVSIALLDGKFHTVVWVWRGESRRIISFRRSRRGEEKQYRAVYG